MEEKPLTSAVKKAVAAATVRFPNQGGQGVLVRGGFVVTAAHVIEWTHEGWMTLRDNYPGFVQPIQAAGGELLVYPFAVEPCADLAVLGALDSQSCPDESDAFEQFCEATSALTLNTTEFPYATPVPAHVLTHTGRWISGHVAQWQPEACTLSFKTAEGIECGTSGGPVVSDDGHLIGVISTAAGPESEPHCDCSIPRPHLAAPVWLAKQMLGKKVNRRWYADAMRQRAKSLAK